MKEMARAKDIVIKTRRALHSVGAPKPFIYGLDCSFYRACMAMVHNDEVRFNALLTALQHWASKVHARVRAISDTAHCASQFQEELLTAMERAF